MRRNERVSRRSVDVCLVASQLARRHLRIILQNEAWVRLCSEQELLRKHHTCGTQAPIFIIDMDRRGSSLSGYLRSLRFVIPEARAILLGGVELSTEELCGLMFLGVDGFVPYDRLQDELLSAVRTVSHGRVWIDPEVMGKFVIYSRKAEDRVRSKSQFLKPKKDEALTRREELVLGLLHRQFSNKEIGATLGISANTVKFHVSNIFTKLGVRTRHSVAELTDSWPQERTGDHPAPGAAPKQEQKVKPQGSESESFGAGPATRH